MPRLLTRKMNETGTPERQHSGVGGDRHLPRSCVLQFVCFCCTNKAQTQRIRKETERRERGPLLARGPWHSWFKATFRVCYVNTGMYRPRTHDRGNDLVGRKPSVANCIIYTIHQSTK